MDLTFLRATAGQGRKHGNSRGAWIFFHPASSLISDGISSSTVWGTETLLCTSGISCIESLWAWILSLSIGLLLSSMLVSSMGLGRIEEPKRSSEDDLRFLIGRRLRRATTFSLPCGVAKVVSSSEVSDKGIRWGTVVVLSFWPQANDANMKSMLFWDPMFVMVDRLFGDRKLFILQEEPSTFYDPRFLWRLQRRMNQQLLSCKSGAVSW